MGLPKTNCFYSNSNYFNLAKENQNLSLIGGTYDFGKAGSLSLGAGAERKWDKKEGYKNTPAIEVKYKSPTIFANDKLSFNGQLRFREIGCTEQYRGTVGGTYKLDSKNSVYAQAHLTTKNKNGEWETNTGGWLGYTYKVNKYGKSVSVELQQNIPIFGRSAPTDVASPKTMEELKDSKGSNTMINVILNIPF